MELIDQRGGTYLAQVKGQRSGAPQQVLLEDCGLIHDPLSADYSGQKTEKAHGRVETRRDQSISELRERLTRNQAMVDTLFKRN